MRKLMIGAVIAVVLSIIGTVCRAEGPTVPEIPATTAHSFVPLGGRIVKTMDVGGFDYICVEKQGERTWVAVPDLSRAEPRPPGGGVTGGADPSIPATGEQPVTVKHDELVALVGRFVPGRLYLISDFQTEQRGYAPAPVEPLVVRALTPDRLDARAVSTIRPHHVITYALVDEWNITAASKGIILYREDPAKGLSAYYDWCACKFRRWKDPTAYLYWTDGSPDPVDYYIVHDPTANLLSGALADGVVNRADYRDLYTFDNDPDGGSCRTISIGPHQTAGLPNNVVFSRECRDIIIGPGCMYLTFGAFCGAFHVKGAYSELIVGQLSHHNVLDFCGDGTRIGSGSSFIELGINAAAITIAPEVSQVFVGHYNAYLTIKVSDLTIGNNANLPYYLEIAVNDDVDAWGYGSSAYLDNRVSTIATTLDLAQTTDLENYSYVGIFNTLQSTGVKSISKLTSPPPIPIRLYAEAGRTLTLVHTDTADVTESGRLVLKGADIVLDGGKREFVELERVRITNGHGGPFDVLRLAQQLSWPSAVNAMLATRELPSYDYRFFGDTSPDSCLACR